MTVTLKNYQIKPSKLATTLEVVLCNYTSIERSDIIFEPNPETLGTTLLEIANLPTMREYDRVTVRAQAIKLADPEKIGKGLTKREATIADKTEATILTLWGKNVNQVKLAYSYQFHRMVVRTYIQRKIPTFLPQCGASITPIEDMEDVVDDSFDLDNDTTLDGAQVIGVLQLESIFTCISCKKGAVKKTSTTTGTCQQCATVQKLIKKKVTCKLFIEEGEEHLTVRADRHCSTQ